jgi:AraC-like DNA-binding protein
MHELRAVTLSGYLYVADSVGLDGYAMLREAGISPSDLENPDNRISAVAAVELLERSAERSGCDNFGLLMAEHRTFASLGPIALLLDRLPSVRAVIEALISYRRHMNDIVAVHLTEEGDTALIDIGFTPEYTKVQITDLAIVLGYRVLAGASHGAWLPQSIHLKRRTPAEMAPWRRVFAVPIMFENLFNGFACSSASLDVPNPEAEPMMARHAERLLQLVPLPVEDSPLSDRVRRAIAQLLPNGQARLETVAARLGTGGRALQRSLEQEGTNFAGLLSDVRRDLAQVYLAGTQSVTTIAEQLGYASPSAFTRWFAGEFGSSPQAWRNERRLASDIASPTWMV